MAKRAWALAVFLSASALADVPSDDQALEYVGVFEGAAPGSPVSVALFDQLSGPGNALCGPIAAMVTGTRFRAVLTAQCAAAIRSNANVFVQVTVAGVSPDRMRLRAVPYAIEAGRAQAAADSVAGSALRRDIDRLLRPRICGVTASVDGAGGVVGVGYSGRTTACRAVAGCSTSAMLCTADQVMRFLMLNPGRSLPFADQGWVAVGLQTNSPTDLITNDCNGFNTQSGNARGMTFNQSGPQAPQPAYVGCASAFPTYCCD